MSCEIRLYQSKLIEKCMKRNSIVFLQTGSGKTRIAVMLIKNLSESIYGHLTNGAKRTIFLANTVPLIQQQAKVIKRFIDVEIEYYFGERVLNNVKIDSWNRGMWLKELNRAQILVMSPQILLTIIQHSFLSFNCINLLVYDECHHAQNNHPYSQLMSLLRHYRESHPGAPLPRICGLTATIVNKKCKKDEFYKQMLKLESNMECKVITASLSSGDEGITYVFKPKIHVSLFEPPIVDTNSLIIQRLNHHLNTLKSISLPICKDFIKYFQDLLEFIYEFGYFAFYLKYKSTFKSKQNAAFAFGTSVSEADRQFGIVISLILVDFNDLFTVCGFDELYTDSDTKIVHLSNRITKLLAILEEQYALSSKFLDIIFVKKRSTAVIIHQIFEEINKLHQYEFIKSKFIVGHASMNNFNDYSMDADEQQEVLRKFHDHEINVLIGTNVVEEGVDVPECNTVIRFDLPQTFGSFVQAKGRARAKNSTYYLFASSEEDINHIRECMQIEADFEREMTNNLNDNAESDEEDFNFEEPYEIGLEPYKKHSAQITPISSVELINRYSQMLCTDGMIVSPKWEIIEHSIDKGTLYTAKLYLPPNSIMNECVESALSTRKKIAKMSSSLKMCARLDELGEFDDNLIPVSRESWAKRHFDFDPDKNESEDTQDRKIGSTKLKRVYKKRIACALQNNHPIASTRNCYVYFFQFINDKEEPCNNGFDLGLITSKKIDFLPSFRSPNANKDYFVQVQQVSLGNRDEFMLENDDFDLIKEFNQILFGKILNSKLDFDFSTSQYGGLIVPLLKNPFQIDFKLIKSIGFVSMSEYLTRNPNDDLSNKQYLAVFNNSFRILTKIHHDKRANDKHPIGNNHNFISFFQEKYNLDTTCEEQPLVQLDFCAKSCDLFHSNGNNCVKIKKQEKYEALYISEHVTLFTVDIDLFQKLNLIPSILYRLNCLLRTNELKNQINGELVKYVDSNDYVDDAGSWFESIKFNRITKKVVENDLEMIVPEIPAFIIKEKNILNGKISLPNTYEILQVLTLKNANDSFDLERYEIMGDCFLKLTTSLYLYSKFPRTNEGNLSTLKSQRVSNRYLFKLARDRGLPEFLMSERFDANQMWFPPNTQPDESRTQFSLGDKSIADCFEAFLGLYLIKCGSHTARFLLSWFGFEITKQDGVVDFTNFAMSLPNPLIDGKSYVATGKFARLETRLGYKFKNELYLQQAFTHPSYMNKNRVTGSYQRLEFIGDAVLDILVTQHLFNDKKEHSPGELTDLRQALVNNKFFAHLALDLGLEKYLEYDSQQIFFELNEFIKANEKYTPENAYFTSSDDGNDMDAIDCPKFLADAFEAVAGAVFVDCGCNLDIIWSVYYKIFASYFVLFKHKTPKSPIRALLDLKPQAKFKIEQLKDDFNRVYYEVKIEHNEKSHEEICSATASTKLKAKLKACKQAIKKIDPQTEYYYF